MTGADLRRRRAALGLSRDKLARLLGTTVNTVLRWELGRMPIRHAEMLGLGLDALEAAAKREG